VAVTLADVREFALPLPRTYERLIRDRVFACPKQERAGLLASDPVKFLPPERSDERYNWVVVRLTEIDRDELREIVEDAWRMVVPKRLAAEVLGPP
jgi:hypothetical protein